MTSGPATTAGGHSERPDPHEVFREQAWSAYRRDFGTHVPAGSTDDLDRRSRLSPRPFVAAALAILGLVALGMGIQVPVTVSVTPVHYDAGQLTAVPRDGTVPARMVGAAAELRESSGRRIPAQVIAVTRWSVGDRQLDAVVLRANGDLPPVRPNEITAVVTLGQQSLFDDLFQLGSEARS